MARSLPIWILALGACGRIGFDPAPDAPPTTRIVIGADPSQVRDTEIWANFPTFTFGGGDHYSINEEVALVWFDLSSVPPGMAVVSATMTVTTTDQAAEDGGTVLVYRMREAWEEGDTYEMPGWANWRERATGVLWSAEGAMPPSRDDDPLVEFRPSASHTVYRLSLPPSLIEDWLADPASNFGVALVVGTATQHIHMWSTEAGHDWNTLELELIRS